MAVLGKINPMRVVKEVEFGIYLDGGSDGEILMPKRYVPEDTKVDDVLNAFIYKDSEDRIIATTLIPKVMAGEFAALEVVDVNEYGAFLEWGLPKNLFVPFREQRAKMIVGKVYPVFVYVDFDSARLAASAKIDKYIDEEVPEGLKEGDQVDILVYSQTDLGWKAIINQRYAGLFYKNEVFKEIFVGMSGKAFIKKIREEDGKIDLTFDQAPKVGYERIEGFAGDLIEKLKAAGGELPFGDKSPSAIIYKEFGVSKRTFKNALGDLYRKRVIKLEKEKITLLK